MLVEVEKLKKKQDSHKKQHKLGFVQFDCSSIDSFESFGSKSSEKGDKYFPPNTSFKSREQIASSENKSQKQVFPSFADASNTDQKSDRAAALLYTPFPEYYGLLSIEN